MVVANCLFNFAYNMMLGPLVAQACQMDLSVGHATLNGSVLNLADTLAVIAFIPLLDVLIWPLVLEAPRGHRLAPLETIMINVTYFFKRVRS